MDYLVSITAIVCQLSSPYKLEYEKLECMDLMVNCATDSRGDIVEKKVDECRKEQERKQDD